MAPMLPTIEDIRQARERIAPHATVTPLIEHTALNELAGGRVLLKAENLQRVGAFKFRGAYNAVSRVDRDACPGGVVACSSGNHAQGVAAAAQLCDMSATIVMPRTAPALKIAKTREFGAETVLYDRETEDREAIAARLAKEKRAALIHPFNDPYVMAGQGTVGLELMEQARALGAVPDQVLVCAAGGGLTSGIAIAVKDEAAETSIHTVEPAGFDDFARSLAAGERVSNAARAGSICDALLVETPGDLTFAVCNRLCGPGLVVTDHEARQAVRYAFQELKLVVEPGGAVALAAIMTGKIKTDGRVTAATLSGGNVDAQLFAQIIQQSLE